MGTGAKCCVNYVQALKEQIINNSGYLFSYFEKIAGELLREDLFKGKRERKLVNEIFKKYGWTFANLSEMNIRMEQPGQNIVLFSAMIMDRWLFVHWIENADSEMINEKWVRHKIDDIAKKFLQGQTVEDNFLKSLRTSFLNRPAVVTTGLWIRNDIIIGGPFKNYTFYDEKSKRVYMIDTFVFNPGKKKLPLLKRLDVIANTFSTEYVMNKAK